MPFASDDGFPAVSGARASSTALVPDDAPRPPRPAFWWFAPDERLRLAGLYGFIGLLHVVGWGLCLHHATAHPSLAALCVAAYLLGLRHAFDADHITAIDDTVRFLLHEGRRPLGIGFFFSLGHASVVFAFTVAIATSAAAMAERLPVFTGAGAIVGTTVSALFLLTIGLLNLRVFVDLVRARRGAAIVRHAHRRPALRAAAPLARLVTRSWHMYPIGLLFGLGFDTATSVGLLALGGLATGPAPIDAVLALPLLFAAGMTIVDTTDGVLMSRAYGWAASDGSRRAACDLTMTGISVSAALVVGLVELREVAARVGELGDVPFDYAGAGAIGGLVAGGLVIAAALPRALGRLRHRRAPRLL